MKYSLFLIILASSLFPYRARSGGISDGGTNFPTEVECEFSGPGKTILFTVLAAAYDLPQGSGKNTYLSETLEYAGKTQTLFAYRFRSSQSKIENSQGGLTMYQDEQNLGISMTARTTPVALSASVRENFRYIDKEIRTAGYSNALLKYPKLNIDILGFCIFNKK